MKGGHPPLSIIVVNRSNISHDHFIPTSVMDVRKNGVLTWTSDKKISFAEHSEAAIYDVARATLCAWFDSKCILVTGYMTCV